VEFVESAGIKLVKSTPTILKGEGMINLIGKILATIVAWFAVIGWFNPKYRYNEHCQWKPELLETLVIVFLGLLIFWAIWWSK